MSHYYDRQPETASEISYTEAEFAGRNYRFATDRGVFSRGHVDSGTRLLLESVIPDLRDPEPSLPAPLKLLDLACGYGVMGIVLKRTYPAFDLTLTDVNERALALTEENLLANDVRYAQVLASDGFEALADERYSVIVCNPPIRAGKPVVQRLLQESHEYLAEGGRLYAVIGKKQGAPSYQRFLEEIFGQVERIGRGQGFYVLRCIK